MNDNSLIAMLSKYSMIENVRLIYDFVNTIDMRSKTNKAYYNGTGGLSKRYKIIADLTDYIEYKIIGKCFLDNLLLRQNPLSNYIEFWNLYFPDDSLCPSKTDSTSKDSPYKIIANLVNYFRCINRLSERKKKDINPDDIPYIYEDICLSICETAGCESSYFLYSEGDNRATILTQSGERVKNASFEVLKIVNEYYSHIDHSSDGIDSAFLYNPIIDGVGTFEYENHHYVILSMPLFDQSVSSQMFYIFLQFNETLPEENDVLRLASKILFMQERLLYNIRKDYAALLHFRNDYGYIKTVQLTTSSHKLKVLHLSDFHVNLNKRWEIGSENVKRILKYISKAGKSFDLLAVTGDLVHASSNAKEAQDKYTIAETLLYQIAKQLWGYAPDKKAPLEDRILPNDWKKRVIITSGNHDYAAMNDVVVKTKSRVTRSAEPADSNAGTMSKFTYLLEFLQRFLDLPVSELIDNNLNEFRCYRNLSLNVVALNTVSPANSLQNNKVGLSDKQVKKLICQIQSNTYPNLVLAHHSPIYEISYLVDIYTPYNLFPIDDSANTTLTYKLYKSFSSVVKSTSRKGCFSRVKIEELKASFDNIQRIINQFQIDEKIPKDTSFTSALKAHNKLDSVDQLTANHIRDWITRFCESDLYLDIKHLIDYYYNNSLNEFSARLFNKLFNIRQMQRKDRKALSDNYQQLLFASDRVLTVLSGHEHEYKSGEFKKSSCTEKIPVHIIGMLEKEIGKLFIDLESKEDEYYTITINKPR